MNREMLVSIIIPVYNVRAYLDEAINSVINQTYKNLDIIIVDDGSTDGSGDICDNYALLDSRIRVVHQANGGLSAARNTGLEIIEGEAIAFLDSDDAYHENYIEDMIAVMVRDNADMVICKYQNIQTTGIMSLDDKMTSAPKIINGKYSRVDALRHLVDGTINTMVWNKLYKRKVLNSIRFPVGRVYEDIAVIYKLFDKSDNVSVINEPLYLRRINPSSITNTTSIKHADDCFKSLTNFEEYVRSNIPNIFNNELLSIFQKYKLTWMIHYYSRLIRNNNREAITFCVLLRKSIIDLHNEIDLKEPDWKKLLRYTMIKYTPSILRMVYVSRDYGKCICQISKTMFMDANKVLQLFASLIFKPLHSTKAGRLHESVSHIGIG